MTDVTELYRYEESRVWETSVMLRRYKVVKETPQGYWIIADFYSHEQRWVSKNGRSAWAKTTPEAALESFKARKARQIAILEKQLQRAKDAHNIALCDEEMAVGKSSKNYSGMDLWNLEQKRYKEGANALRLEA
jgi:hypothetical protein